MAIIKLLIKVIRLIVQALGLSDANTKSESKIEAEVNVLTTLAGIRKQNFADLFEPLEADAQETLALAALKYEDESLAMDLIRKIKNPDYAYRSLKEAIKLFQEQGKTETLANAIKLSYPLLPKLSFATTPSAGLYALNQLAVEHLKPNIAWSILVKSEKVLPALNQLDQDVGREFLVAAKLSVLRSSNNAQRGQKMLQEITTNIEGIDSANIKDRAKVTLLEAQLAVYQQFGDQEAWQEAQHLGTSLQKPHDPRPLAMLVQTALKKGEQADLAQQYLKQLEQARAALGEQPFLWVSHLKTVAKAYQTADQLDNFFAWIAGFPAAYELWDQQEESSYLEDPFSKNYPYRQVAEICLQYHRTEEARVFLGAVVGMIPLMTERHLNLMETMAAYLEQLARLYQLEKQSDILDEVARAFAAYEAPIQSELLVQLAKTYYAVGLNDKGNQQLKDIPVCLANAPAKKRAVWGRAYKPIYAHLPNEQSAQILLDSMIEMLVLENEPFRQAMFVVEFLRGAEDEKFSFFPASAERLIEGLDRHGHLFAKTIGRAEIVKQIALSPKQGRQILNDAWQLLKEQSFDKDLREQLTWVLPIAAKYELTLTKEMFDHMMPSLQALPESTQKEDWQDTICWGISHGPITDWGIAFIQTFGEAASEKTQAMQALTIKRWSQQNPALEELVSLLEIAAKIVDPPQKAIALSGIVAATARIEEWDYAFRWVAHIKLHYYTALAYIEMMLASKTPKSIK
ncbi:MAG: hypothetical protein AB8H47_14285 [Bacteroidia bacterium]